MLVDESDFDNVHFTEEELLEIRLEHQLEMLRNLGFEGMATDVVDIN